MTQMFVTCIIYFWKYCDINSIPPVADKIDGTVQHCSVSIANALEIPELFYIKTIEIFW